MLRTSLNFALRRCGTYIQAAILASALCACSVPGTGAGAAAGVSANGGRPPAAGVASARGGDIRLAAFGSFIVPGEAVVLNGVPPRVVTYGPNLPAVKVEQNGKFETGQMYVQYMLLAKPTSRLPLLMWHGGGSTASIWESSPDGRPGWATHFLKAGYSLYLSDAVERGRSGFSQYPQIYHSEPLFRTEREAWEEFRIGTWNDDPALRQVFAGHQFPVDAFDGFMRMGVPRWVDNDPAAQRAYDRLVKQVCPCLLIAHSQGTQFALRAAARYPDLVKALVLIEPFGVPTLSGAEKAALGNVPHLLLWGDFIDKSRLWRYEQHSFRAYFDALPQGEHNAWVELPRLGISGNSHFMMLDENSDVVADVVEKWLKHEEAAMPQTLSATR